jgi:hypothetical protein
MVQMNPSGANRAQVRGLIGDAMVEFRDSNDDVIHEAASNVELSYTTLNDSLFSTSMRAIDSRCRHHYVLGWDE